MIATVSIPYKKILLSVIKKIKIMILILVNKNIKKMILILINKNIKINF